MEVWVPVVVALVSSLSAYLLAVSKGKNDLETMKVRHEAEMETFQKKHTLDLERLEKEQNHEIEKIASQLSSESEHYEKTAQTDLIKDIAGDFMKTPEMKKELQRMMMQGMLGGSSKKK